MLRSDNLETNYYSMREYFLRLFDENYREFGFFGESKEELTLWQKDTRVRLLKLLGFDKMKGCDLNPVVVESEELDGYKRESRY